jgi:hypothetical protein
MDDTDAGKPAAPVEKPVALPASPVAEKRDAPPAPAAAAEAPHPLAELVDRWWADHFPGSVVGRDTQIWNHAFRATQDLKRRLRNFGKV